jgi:hypothetical protein
VIRHDTHLLIGSLMFDGIDQIDLTGPFEVLSRVPNSTCRIYARTDSPVRDLNGLRWDSRRDARRGAAGVTAGIDGALRLAAELRGDEAAQAIQLDMVYAKEPPFNSRTPESALPSIVEQARPHSGRRRPGGSPLV